MLETFSGSAVIGAVEYSLPNQAAFPAPPRTESGRFQLAIHSFPLGHEDVYRLRVYEKLLAVGAQQMIYEAILYGAELKQNFPFWTLEPLMLLHGWDMTLQKLAGNDQQLAWSIRKYADIAEEAGGSRVVSTTDWSLATDSPFSPVGPLPATTGGLIQLLLDLSGMGRNNQYDFLIWEPLGTALMDRYRSLSLVVTGPQRPLVIPVRYLPAAWDMSLIKHEGPDCNFDWSIRRSL